MNFYDLPLLCCWFYNSTPSLSTIFSKPLHTFFCLYQPYFYIIFHRGFRVFISSFVSLYSLNTIVTKINLWCLLYESIKALEIKTSNVFNLAFANNTIWSWFFLFFLTIDLYFLIAAVNVHVFNPTAECAVPIGINN